MADHQEAGSEQDDVSFLRTGDIVCLTCIAQSKEAGISGGERVCLSAEGFGNRICYLENVSDRNVPPETALSMFYIDQALSVRALQEMMSGDNHQESTGSGGHRTLLYGHAVQLRHQQSNMFLACLSTSTSNDKLAFDVGLQETNDGEVSWWTIHPASKQRSEGEKVRVGDDVILVSVATERYLHIAFDTTIKNFLVIASFHQTLWNINPVSSGGVRSRNMGWVFGNDVLRLFHGQDECLTIPENWSDHPQHNMIIYQGGNAVNQARSLWRLELVRTKWHGALVGWEQVFRIRHITSGRYLGITADHQVCLFPKDKADFDSTAFILLVAKDAKRQGIEEKEEEGMGPATLKYGETVVFIQHLSTNLWMSYQTTEVTKKGVGKVEEKKAIVLEEGHMDDCFQFFMAQEEESKSARVIRKCSAVLNRFLKGIDGLQNEGRECPAWQRVNLPEILKLMEDLIDYFAQPAEETEFEEKQTKLKALRNRQDLFQEEGVLNMILDTIDRFSQMESLANFSSLVTEEHQKIWEEISTYLYLLLAAMIKGNHSNCAQFASAQRLDWLFGRLANPQSAEGILDVLYCVLTESPEALNMIAEVHIKSVISLLEKVGRDPKVLDVLRSLCLGNGLAVRSSQNSICNNLLPGRDLLLQTAMVDHVSSVMPRIFVGVVPGSAMFLKWYFEAEVEHIEQMSDHPPTFRVGWANTDGYVPYPGSGEKWGGNGVGDDVYSYAFDGRCLWTGGVSRPCGTRPVQKGDVFGCALDLSLPEISFYLNGHRLEGCYKNFNITGFFFPAMTMSARVSCRFVLGGEHGKLRFPPPRGHSAVSEAIQGILEIGPCFSFGDSKKNIYCGPQPGAQDCAFVPSPIDLSHVTLPTSLGNLHEKLAENMHELWAMNKIENGWTYGDKRSESKHTHPCLTNYERLPSAEKKYNLSLAHDTIKTCFALGYHLTLEKPPTRLKTLRLGNNFMMPNGYKPAPLDTREVELDDKMMVLVEHLAKNTHNVWAKEKISRGWTYGINEDPIMKRNPHLVPYDRVDERIKQANRETASETIRTLMTYGYVLEPPNTEVDLSMTKEMQALKQNTRTYRAERTYAVTAGKWYYEVEILTNGFSRIGWMDVCAPPEVGLGDDEFSFGFDGYLVRKWHQGPDPYGKTWNVGDIIGCFLDLNDKTISFSLNGELLLDYSGAEMAFDCIQIGDGFVPAFTLATGQRARFNFGQESTTLKYFTTCGLQDGYEPFCVNMYRQMPLWYNKELALFENVEEDNPKLEVSRIAPSSENPPCLKVSHKTFGAAEKANIEFLRLGLPVKCNSIFVKNKNRDALQMNLRNMHREHYSDSQFQGDTKSQGLLGKIFSSAPKEFGMDGPITVEPEVPQVVVLEDEDHEPRLGTLRTSFATAKAQSLDVEGPMVVSPTLQPPTLSWFHRMAILREYGLYSLDETSSHPPLPPDELNRLNQHRVSSSETDLNVTNEGTPSGGSDSKVRPKKLGVLQSLGQRVRDASMNRQKKQQASEDRSKSSRPRSVETTSALRTVKVQDPSAVQMPKTGPGRKERKRKVSTKLEESPINLDDDSWEMQQMIDQIDEYFVGIRIFPGQDPSHVWVGCVTPQYHHTAVSFSSADTRAVKYVETGPTGQVCDAVEYRNCYMVNANELLKEVTDQSDTGSSKMSGLLIGLIIDTSSGEVSFMANGKETKFKYRVEPGTLLYPSAFVAPTSKDILQFELGRIKYTLPLSAALFKSVNKSLQPICPPCLKVQALLPYHWSRVPNQCVRVNALRLSEIRGWSVLCDDPVPMLAIYVPEMDRSFDVLEMVEYPELLKFHAQTLELYGALCAQGNIAVAHQLCKHVNEAQLFYAIQNPYMSGALRCGFHDLLIAIHLEIHAERRLNTASEYIIPLSDSLRNKDVFSDEAVVTFPAVFGHVSSIRPTMVAMDVQDRISKERIKLLKPPKIDFELLREHAMESLTDGTGRAVMNCRDLIGGNNKDLFVPLLKMIDQLLLIGLLSDDDIRQVLILIDPASFDETYIPGTTKKGLMEVDLAEGVKLQLCNLLNHLCDIQLRHRVESLIGFAEGFVAEVQQDQCKRYIYIKQSDMGPAEAAKKTKEFRCPPKEQMIRLLSFKKMEALEMVKVFDEEGDYEECPMAENLQRQLLDFHNMMVIRVARKEPEAESMDLIKLEEDGWVDKLASMLVPMPPPILVSEATKARNGAESFRQMIITNLIKWAQEKLMEDPHLIREMFRLLLKQYSGIAELMNALEKTYVIHERNRKDIELFLVDLELVRGLLSVQMEATEEEIMRDALWSMMNNKVFFQHPDLMRILKVHENVMTIMINILGRAQQAAEAEDKGDALERSDIADMSGSQTPVETRDTSEMVVACCRFLCYFCRSSSQNQKAMFDHLSFLLDNASMLLARPSLRGSVPLDVGYSSFMDNNELALALKEEELDKVAISLSRCGLQSNSELTAKGYPDIGWDPVEGERFLDFLRFTVWINGETVEENANLVIRLLIRRPECLGPALKGESQGLFAAFKEGISMSEEIRAMQEGHSIHGGVYLGDSMNYPREDDEGEDYLDLGGAQLSFYSGLVDLLGKCAPDPVTISQGKGESLRARAILRSLVSLDDLEAILSLRFNIPNIFQDQDEEAGSSLPAGLLPNHKQSILLFLERVYMIETQEMFFRLLEQSFLPDLRAATMLDAPRASESDIALALNRYLCNAVLPLLTQHAQFFADAEQQAALVDATLHTVYRMSKLKSLTNNQRAAVSDFLVAITREMSPPMMLKLLRKVVVDIPSLTEFAIVPLKIMTLHYERCGKYYGNGNNYGIASEEEKRLTMILFSAIFDSLGKRAYDPELFGRALPCLTAIACALSPDATLTTSAEDEELFQKNFQDEGLWIPRPVDTSSVNLNQDLSALVTKFAEHFHDSWATRKIDKGWTHGEIYSRANLTHPRLKPFSMLREQEKTFYRDRCQESLKALLAWNYRIELTDPDAARRIANNNGAPVAAPNPALYNPRPVDLSNMSLTKDMTATAEKMAENAHQIWAKKIVDDLSAKGSAMSTTLAPWDILTDFEKQKNRFLCQEILKFLQFNGFKVSKVQEGRANQQEMERATIEKRFAYSLLDKLLVYLDNAALMMKITKPSSSYTRRNSFKQSTQDVKFFGKVVLPLMEAYFKAHRMYFLNSSGISQTGVASNREKEMVASLFCRLALFIRRKVHAFGCDSKITVSVLHVLVQTIDARTLVRINSDIVRTSLLMFFHNAAEDLIAAVTTLKEAGQYSDIRGANLKSWTSLEFAHQVLVPVLTSMFNHLATNGFGQDLLLGEIQVACYKILDSLYSLTLVMNSVRHRAQIKEELDKHRPPLGQCLAAFANSFPVAFLEPEFNMNNRFSVLAKFEDQSVQAQSMLQSLSANIPKLDKLIGDIVTLAAQGGKYADAPQVFDVDLPMICSYLNFWFPQGPQGTHEGMDLKKQVSFVTNDSINKVFHALLRLIRDNIGVENAPWMCRVAPTAIQIVNNVTADPLAELLLPVSSRLKASCEDAFKEEDRLRTHPEEVDEGEVAECNARLVRDVYAFFPLLIKYTDLHRAQWLKSGVWEADKVYENVSAVFNTWSHSQHFKREELNLMAQFDEDAMTGGEMKTGKAAIAERKKKRRQGNRKDKEQSSVVVQTLKRLLPVGLNVFGGRELDIVQHCKDKFLQKENEDKIREFVRLTLEIPEKTDPTDKNTWQRNLYQRIGKSQMRGITQMTQEMVIEKIMNMGLVLNILHTVEHPQLLSGGAWRKLVSPHRKRAVVACFRVVALYSIPRHRCINLFLRAYRDKWLTPEDVGQDELITVLTDSRSEENFTQALAVPVKPVEEGDESEDAANRRRPDALKQLILCFMRSATAEQKAGMASITEDELFISYSDVMAKSIHLDEDEDGGGDEDEEPKSQQELEMEKQQLLLEQGRLANRGAAIMVLQYTSICNGEPSDLVANTLQLGIHLLSGGNKDVQAGMLTYLMDKKDVRFFTSIAGLMSRGSVLNLETFERQNKAEGLGMGAELAVGGSQNLNDADFICSLFRFLQLTCEGHNLDFQNYLRTQPGNTTSINLIICTVDYLLRLQESIMDFYWHYSSKEVVDEAGKQNFLRAITVCSQVFNTLTESIQGPCLGNQLALAHSRLWDAINGFFFLFAHMMDKLSKNSTQLELLREFLGLQKDMIVLMLSMLEGNVLNGPIGKQMVETLVESQQNVEMILKFFDMFLKLKDMTTSTAFQEFDLNKDGWISPKEFQKAMETQKMYSIEEINYLMMCTDVNNDGKVDYMEFTERFHNPAKDIGFNLAVLLTNLNEHITHDHRMKKIMETAASMLEYFEPFLGRIEIMGSAKRVEKVYFEIQEDWLEQWKKPQIKESKNEFLHAVMQDPGEKGKLEAFVNFCEDTIFEMEHATKISADDADSRIERAKAQRDSIFRKAGGDGEGSLSATDIVLSGFGLIGRGIVGTFNFLRPKNLNNLRAKGVSALRQMTYGELLINSCKLGFKTTYSILWLVFFIISTLVRFVLYMMSGCAQDLEPEKPATLALPSTSGGSKQLRKDHSSQQSFHMPLNVHDLMAEQQHFEAFGIQIVADESPLNVGSPRWRFGARVHVRGDLSSQPSTSQGPDLPETPVSPSSTEPPLTVPLTPVPIIPDRTPTPTVPHRQHTVFDAASMAPSGLPPAGAPFSGAGSLMGDAISYEPKIAESPSKAKGSFFSIFARHFYKFKYTTLGIAFVLNFILLFYRVEIYESGKPGGDTGAESSELSSALDVGEGESGGGDDSDEPLEEILMNWGNYLNPTMRVLAFCHLLASIALLIAYIQLKVPVIIFKNEKEVARKLEFEGMWITQEASEEGGLRTVFDGVVISAASFPVNYWDKFVKKKCKEKYKEQFDEDQLEKLLGMDQSADGNKGWLRSIDWRYNIWKLGIIFMDGPFQYLLGYVICSALGNYNAFFFAAHLVDVVISFKMLQTILKSVTHNGQQLILTVMMTLVVVYLYTVIAFNFFRKFYVQEEDEGEPDRKCHDMLTCFIYHFYAGVRAGGGIGDELESPYGDEKQYFRMLFDITFFFFIIVILLAIMQGLIIDAFGELRDQLESVKENLESNCFICELGKDYFDKLPKGFEKHTQKDHNLANYLFFLMHLINKDETEYTGQETYVYTLYAQRCWDFFPVGEAFLKQYEDELMSV